MQQETKLIEVRDSATFIPISATRLIDDQTAATYLLRRAGYVRDAAVLVCHLQTGKGSTDLFSWLENGTRTMHLAHRELATHWDDYQNGDVLDVQVILGETTEKKISEQVTDLLDESEPTEDQIDELIRLENENRGIRIPTYHDVMVEAAGETYEIFNNYGVQLQCTKVGGWQLWTLGRKPHETLIGGEYDNAAFAVRLKDGTKICGPTKATTPEDDD